MNFLAIIHWNQSRFIWVSEKLGVQISWYGLCFSLGVFLSCLLGIRLALSYCKDVKEKTSVKTALENFSLYSLLFIVLGARVAYILFYGGRFYWRHPAEIIKIWHGGLASHGGILALILWAWCFAYRSRKTLPRLSFLFLVDLCAAAFGCAAFLIRIGNFMNQEIVGTPTSLPWGVVFSNPTDGILGQVVHPVQLYEGISYLIFSIVIYYLCYAKRLLLGSGLPCGFALMGTAVIRFLAEFVKSHQGNVVSEASYLTIGQMLSCPMFLLGLGIVFVYFIRKKRRFRFFS